MSVYISVWPLISVISFMDCITNLTINIQFDLSSPSTSCLVVDSNIKILTDQLKSDLGVVNICFALRLTQHGSINLRLEML